MELEPSLLSLPALLEQGLALVRERAARQRLAVALDGRARGRRGVGGRDQAQAGRGEPGDQRGQVHAGRRGGATSTRGLVGEEAVVTVRDTGVGIAPEDQERIFEAFQRGDRRASVEGTGLGLTLSKRFVELHGGRMWVESALGAGVDVRVRDPGGCAMRLVLIVEDNERNLKLVRDVLGFAGFDVLGGARRRGGDRARAGATARRRADGHQPAGDDRLRGAGGAARGRADGVDPGARGDGVRDEGRPRADPRRGLRRLRGEAGRRARAARPGRGADPRGDPRRRRPARRTCGCCARCSSRAATRSPRRRRARRRWRCWRRAAWTSSCST